MTADEAQEGDPLMGPSLVDWMTAHDVTIPELARALGGISPTTVKNWRSGQGMSPASRARLEAFMTEREAQAGRRGSSDHPTRDGLSGQTHAEDVPNRPEPALVSANSTDGHMVIAVPEDADDVERAELQAELWRVAAAWNAKRATAALEALRRATGGASSQTS